MEVMALFNRNRRLECEPIDLRVIERLVDKRAQFLVDVVNLLIVVAAAPDLTVGPAPMLK